MKDLFLSFLEKSNLHRPGYTDSLGAPYTIQNQIFFDFMPGYLIIQINE